MYLHFPSSFCQTYLRYIAIHWLTFDWGASTAAPTTTAPTTMAPTTTTTTAAATTTTGQTVTCLQQRKGRKLKALLCLRQTWTKVRPAEPIWVLILLQKSWHTLGSPWDLYILIYPYTLSPLEFIFRGSLHIDLQQLWLVSQPPGTPHTPPQK